MTGCLKNKITGKPNIYGDVCKSYLKGWVTWDQPPVIYYIKTCIECGLDLTVLEVEKEIKPAILPPLKKSAAR